MEDNTRITSWDNELKKSNTNETDYEKFLEFKNEQDVFNRRQERERIIAERKHALALWDNYTPSRWRGASLSKIENLAAAEILGRIQDHGYGSFFLDGEAGCGKTYIGYAIVRKFIGAGLATFSNIKVIDEEAITSMAYTGYVGRQKFEELLDPKYKVYVIDNISDKDDYPEKEARLLERLIDHIYANSLLAIFVSTMPANVFSQILNDSAEVKLMSIVENREITVTKH